MQVNFHLFGGSAVFVSIKYFPVIAQHSVFGQQVVAAIYFDRVNLKQRRVLHFQLESLVCSRILCIIVSVVTIFNEMIFSIRLTLVLISF